MTPFNSKKFQCTLEYVDLKNVCSIAQDYFLTNSSLDIIIYTYNG